MDWLCSYFPYVGSLLAIGALFGSLSAVFLMDAVGRKASLLAFSVMSLFIGWTLLMAASQAWQLYVGRFLLGLGAGMEITISPVYIHETTKVDMRDVCGTFPQVRFVCFGFILSIDFLDNDSSRHCLLLCYGKNSCLELAQSCFLSLPYSIHLWSLLHSRESSMARVQ